MTGKPDDILTLELKLFNSSKGENGAHLVQHESMPMAVFVPRKSFIDFEIIGSGVDHQVARCTLKRSIAKLHGVEVVRDTSTADLFNEGEG